MQTSDFKLIFDVELQTSRWYTGTHTAFIHFNPYAFFIYQQDLMIQLKKAYTNPSFME